MVWIGAAGRSYCALIVTNCRMFPYKKIIFLVVCTLQEELRISSVYSVGGGSTFTSPTGEFTHLLGAIFLVLTPGLVFCSVLFTFVCRIRLGR